MNTICRIIEKPTIWRLESTDRLGFFKYNFRFFALCYDLILTFRVHQNDLDRFNFLGKGRMSRPPVIEMQPLENDPHNIRVMLARRVGHRPDAAELASFSVSIWHEIEATLQPLFGERAIFSFYSRTLEITALRRPCLSDADECDRSPGKFARLAAVLVGQRAEDAADILVTLLNNFHDLLTQLFGGSMFERLLRSIWDQQSDRRDLIRDRHLH